jgi:c-di-GMP-binding flagellar brake protein YcgR
MMEEGIQSRIDRRRHERVNVSFPFVIRKLRAGAEEFRQEFIAKDISAAGLFFHAPRRFPFRPGDEVSVNISPPENVGDTFPFSRLFGKAKVVRIEDLLVKGEGEVGVALGFDLEKMDYLLRF